MRWAWLLVLAISGHFWLFLAISGHFWHAVACRGMLWRVVACCGLLWPAVALADCSLTAGLVVRSGDTFDTSAGAQLSSRCQISRWIGTDVQASATRGDKHYKAWDFQGNTRRNHGQALLVLGPGQFRGLAGVVAGYYDTGQALLPDGRHHPGWDRGGVAEALGARWLARPDLDLSLIWNGDDYDGSYLAVESGLRLVMAFELRRRLRGELSLGEASQLQFGWDLLR